nr:MAG TPA: RimP N-terminal domain [Caudoviricetes sp.]
MKNKTIPEKNLTYTLSISSPGLPYKCKKRRMIK